MKKHLPVYKLAALILLLFVFGNAKSQLEWRLVNPVVNEADPDGNGPAKGSVSFTLQIRSASGSVPNITGLSTGWSWQAAGAMLPNGPGPVPFCGSGTPPAAQPGNVVMSPAFAALGFTYNNVNQCSGNVNFTTNGKGFNRRAVGTIDGGNITLTTTWQDVFTTTLWLLGASEPRGGYVVINSGAGAPSGAFSSYAVSDADGKEFVVNSLTYATPLALGSTTTPLPVKFAAYAAQCTETGTVVTWSTATESNSSHFEVEKSSDGVDWTTLARINTTANSNSLKSYRYTDKAGGTALYRVKQVSLSGVASYTDYVRTACGEKAFFVNLYPVPAKDKLNLVVGSDKAFHTTARILDNSGRIVLSVPLNVMVGTNNFTIRIDRLPQGQYFLRSTEGGVEINQSFAITR